MKKLLFILGFLLPVVLYGQNTFKYPVNANGGLRVGGADHSLIDSAKVVNSHFSLWRGSTPYYGISDTTGLEYIDGLTSDAQDQLDALSADIDTLETDTVDIDDVALQLYQYALEPADSTADSTVNYVTHTQLVLQASTDLELTLNALGNNIIAQSVGCDLSLATVEANDMSDRSAMYQAVYIKKDTIITGAYFVSAENGSFNQTAFNGIALFTYGSDDTLRQIAISANDSTKWETGTGIIITFPFTTPETVTAGLYYLGIMYNCAGTASTTPELASSVANNSLKLFKTSVYVATQDAFPAKLKLSDATVYTSTKWFGLY